MSDVCPALGATSEVVPSLAAFIECQAQALGHSGFSGVLARPAYSDLLIACLTLFIALIGLRLLAGETFSLADGTRAALRVGVVIVFSTSWAAYEAVFYDVAIQTPSAMADGLLSPLGLNVGSIEGTASAFQEVYDKINHRTAGPPSRLLSSNPAGAPTSPDQARPAADSAAPEPPILPTHLTPEGTAGILLMVSSLAPLLAMRLATGFLLAVGPIVITFALFDATLGVFVGWIRALLQVTLGALSASVVAGVELEFLRRVVVERATTQVSAFTDPGLLVTSAVFTVVGLGGLAAAFSIAGGFTLPRSLRGVTAPVARTSWTTPTQAADTREARRAAQPSRATTIVDAIRRTRTVAPGQSAAPPRSDPVGQPSFAHPAGHRAQETSWTAPRGLSHAPRRGATIGKTASASRRDARR